MGSYLQYVETVKFTRGLRYIVTRMNALKARDIELIDDFVTHVSCCVSRNDNDNINVFDEAYRYFRKRGVKPEKAIDLVIAMHERYVS